METYASAGSEFPVSYAEWEAGARQKLDQPAFDYIAGGAGTEDTMRANLEAFKRWRLGAETDLTMALCGASRFRDIDETLVVREVAAAASGP